LPDVNGKAGLYLREVVNCYTVGSKKNEGLDVGVCRHGTRRKLGLCYRRYRQYIQKHLYAIY